MKQPRIHPLEWLAAALILAVVAWAAVHAIRGRVPAKVKPASKGTISVVAPAGTILALSGPHGSGVCGRCVQPFGGVTLYSGNDLIMSDGGACGWEVPWGRYEVNGEPFAFSPSDFWEYLGWYSAGDARADLTTTAMFGLPGYTVPDGVLDNGDFFYFLDLYANP